MTNHEDDQVDEWDHNSAWQGAWESEWPLEHDEEEGVEMEHARKRREVGAFYAIDPPQATMSKALEHFDLKTFMDRGTPRFSEDVAPERVTFNRAIFYGNVEDAEWIHEILTERMAKIKDKLEIFIGKGMDDPDGPWRLFLIHRSTCGSRVEPE